MLLYRLLTIVLSPLILGHILYLSIKNKQGRYFWQRLGFRCSHLPTDSLWFHCASVGEVNTLLPLLNNIHMQDEQLRFIITTNTVTGGKIVEQQGLDYLYHHYLPFDWVHGINRFLSTIRPRSLYIMETEIWPNLFDLCADNHIPLYLINARLSSKTTSASSWIKSLLSSSLSNVRTIYTRSENDTDAYILLGADKEKIETTGNLKLTTILEDEHTIKNDNVTTAREYILVASTHEDEELKTARIWKNLKRHELLIIAPRHPERSRSIQKQLNGRNLAIRSQGHPITEQTEIYLLDTIGELRNYFEEAKIVIMGGSFVPAGGHNILEPASYHRAIITGPYMENFRQELELMLDASSIIQVRNFDALELELAKLLDDSSSRIALEKGTDELSHSANLILDKYTALIVNKPYPG